MRGEHWPNVEAEQCALHLRCPVAGGSQGAHDPSRGIWLGLVVLGRAVGARPADAVNLFRRVDEEKEQREGASGYRAPVERECGDLSEEGVQRWCARFAMAPRATGQAQRFDGLKGRLALEPADHAAERGGEPSHVVMQRQVLAPYRQIGAAGAGFGHGGIVRPIFNAGRPARYCCRELRRQALRERTARWGRATAPGFPRRQTSGAWSTAG
jgi:hypothetical protein